MENEVERSWRAQYVYEDVDLIISRYNYVYSAIFLFSVSLTYIF